MELASTSSERGWEDHWREKVKSTGAIGLLGKWLLPLGKDTRGPGVNATEEVEQERSLESPGGSGGKET